MAYIKTVEVAAIRRVLKETFGNKYKFSVTRQHGTSVTVAIMAGKTDFSNLWAGKTETDYGYGHATINQYYITEENYGTHVALFKKIVEIIKTAPVTVEGGRAYFDDSDSMSDYFHTAFYFDLQVGKWDRAYENRG